VIRKGWRGMGGDYVSVLYKEDKKERMKTINYEMIVSDKKYEDGTIQFSTVQYSTRQITPK
jgi:hypothetical protein